MGERSLRRLLIIGASAVARWAARKGIPAGSWLGRMLARKPPMLVRVALANKMARIVWRCWPRVGFIELRLRRCRCRHDREAVEAWEGHRRGMAQRSRDRIRKTSFATSASSAWA